jgi:hypothetical protein
VLTSVIVSLARIVMERPGGIAGLDRRPTSCGGRGAATRLHSLQTAVGLVLTIAGPLLVSNRLAGLGPRGDAGGPGGDAPALLRAPLDPRRSNLDGVRALSRGARSAVAVH